MVEVRYKVIEKVQCNAHVLLNFIFTHGKDTKSYYQVCSLKITKITKITKKKIHFSNHKYTLSTFECLENKCKNY